MTITENFGYHRELSLDRAAYPLWKQAVKALAFEILQTDPAMQALKTFAIRVRNEAGAVLQKQREMRDKRMEIMEPMAEIRQYNIEPMVEKFLNGRAIDLPVADPAKVSFLIQDLGGFGDLIFGVRAIKILKGQFPKTSFHVVTNGIDKIKRVMEQADLNCSIGKFGRNCLTPSFDPETQNLLEASDVVFVSPIGCFFTPQKVVKEKRDITLIEYNRPEYGLDISKRRYVTGIGDQALGVFIESPMQSAGREEAVAALDNRSLAACIQALDPQWINPFYFGYGHEDVERFLNVLLNYESKSAIILTPYFSRERLLLPANATVILHQPAKLLDELDVLEAFQKQGAPIDMAKAVQYRQELLEYLGKYSDFETSRIQGMIQKVDQILAEAAQRPPLEQPIVFTQSLTDGYCEMGETWYKSETLTQAAGGNIIHLIKFNGLSFRDTKRIKSVADEICLSTGDQSFSEDLEKLMMYDARKIEPILALARVAEKNGLHHIAQYFLAFSEKKDVQQTVSCLQNRGKLREDMDALYKIVRQEMDLAPQLIGLLKRQMRGQLDASRVHEAFLSYIQFPKFETLINIQAEIFELERRK